MTNMSDRSPLDPDLWIKVGWKLGNYPKFGSPSLWEPWMLLVLGDDHELAEHIGRWMTRIGPSLTEEQLREAWEETRD